MRYPIIFFSLLLPFVIFAQNDIGAIKKDPNFYWAEGHGTTIADADKNAMGKISSQISVTITEDIKKNSKTIYNGTSVAEHYSDLEISRVSTSVTSCLQNVERIIVDDEPNAVVFRYVHKNDVKMMLEERTKKILDLVASGQSAERQLLIDDALRDYYWALMLSKAMPTPVFAEFDGETDEKNCLMYLPSKIKSVLSNINATFVESHTDGNRIFATLDIKYSRHAVSSIQLYYHDGKSYVGPLSARDGFAQLELQTLPNDKQLGIRYEYAFREEAENLDDELKAVFDAFGTHFIDAEIAIPVKVDNKKQCITADKKAKNGVSVDVDQTEKAEIAAIPTADITTKERITLTTPSVTEGYAQTMMEIENAISTNNIESVYKYFEPAAYALLDTLMTRTGKVRLAKKSQNFEFIEEGHIVIARHCKITIRYKSGKTFTENLTFRFNKHSGKIESFAFALTKKAEDDIFNAQSKWPELSRFAIMQFMEDYQTAYALKRIGYLSRIFSDDAVIISGVVARKATPADLEGRATIVTPYVNYKIENKRQYIQRIGGHFRNREYINLKFEDNRSQGVKHPKIGNGKAFAIEIKQNYRSSAYSDKGYLTLLIDASRSPMLIHVRLWQPQKAEIPFDKFVESINFDRISLDEDDNLLK